MPVPIPGVGQVPAAPAVVRARCCHRLVRVPQRRASRFRCATTSAFERIGALAGARHAIWCSPSRVSLPPSPSFSLHPPPAYGPSPRPAAVRAACGGLWRSARGSCRARGPSTAHEGSQRCCAVRCARSAERRPCRTHRSRVPKHHTRSSNTGKEPMSGCARHSVAVTSGWPASQGRYPERATADLAHASRYAARRGPHRGLPARAARGAAARSGTGRTRPRRLRRALSRGRLRGGPVRPGMNDGTDQEWTAHGHSPVDLPVGEDAGGLTGGDFRSPARDCQTATIVEA